MSFDGKVIINIYLRLDTEEAHLNLDLNLKGFGICLMSEHSVENPMMAHSEGIPTMAHWVEKNRNWRNVHCFWHLLTLNKAHLKSDMFQ